MKFPVRKKIWTGDAANAQDVGNLARDTASAINGMVPFSKANVTGYRPTPAAPLAIAVDNAPHSIFASRIQFAGDVSNKVNSPQGGFCSFTYDASKGSASIYAIAAFNYYTGGGLVAGKLYVFDFLVVY